LPGSTAYSSAHKQAVQIWTDDLPIVPIFNYKQYYLAASNMTGLDIKPGVYATWNVGAWDFSSTGTATVAAGGSVTSNDGRVTLAAPANAFTDTVTLSFTPAGIETPLGLFSGGQTFELNAQYQSDGTPASLNGTATFEITVAYGENQLINNQVWAASLGLYYWDGNQWVLEPTSQVNTDNKTVTATPNHLSVWAIFSGEDAEFSYLPLVKK
jgi:hypothetical protein